MTDNDRRYFRDDTLVGRILRFFNLLEPEHMVLSISKIFMWSALAIIVFVLLTMPDNLAAIIGAVSGLGGALGNYVYRRYDASQTRARRDVVAMSSEMPPVRPDVEDEGG